MARPQVKAAYAAGLFDGEGCVEVYMQSGRRRNGLHTSFRVALSVANTDLRPLNWLQENYGGTVAVRENNGYGRRKRPLGFWHVYGDKAQVFAEEILPYSIVKREQLVLWLEARGMLFSTQAGRPRDARTNEDELAARRRVAAEVKELKRVG